jgi:hypothetical protein
MAAGVFSGILPMGFPHRSTGATLVEFGSAADTGSGDDATMLKLGYCEDRVQIDERPQWEDIRNDIFGGMAGIPSEVQYLGSVVYVHCNLNRFNDYHIKKLSSIHPSLSQVVGAEVANQMTGTTGDVVSGPMGAFMRQGDNATITYMETLRLSSATENLTFHKAFLRQGKRFNMGVRHQQVMLVFECHIYSPCDLELYEIAAGTNPCT